MPFPILGTPKPAFFDSSGSPLVSGTLSVLDPADDTNKASYPTYDDAAVPQNANTNPITLDSRGETTNELWGLDGEDYKLVLADSAAANVWTIDDVFTPHGQQAIGKTLWPQTAAELAASVTPTDYSYEPGNVLRYGTNTTPGTTDMTVPLQAALDSQTDVYIPAGDYLISSVVLPVRSNVRGAAMDETVILPTSGSNTFVISSDFITVKDLSFRDTALGSAEDESTITANCLYVDAVSHNAAFLRPVQGCQFERILFMNIKGSALYIAQCLRESYIRDCRFFGMGNRTTGAGVIHAELTLGNGANVNNIQVTGGIFYRYAVPVINAKASTLLATTVPHHTDWHIHDNLIHNQKLETASNVQPVESEFTDNIVIERSSDNYIYSNKITSVNPDHSGISLLNHADYEGRGNFIQNNRISLDTGRTNDGITYPGSGDLITVSEMRSLVVTNNTLGANSADGQNSDLTVTRTNANAMNVSIWGNVSVNQPLVFAVDTWEGVFELEGINQGGVKFLEKFAVPAVIDITLETDTAIQTTYGVRLRLAAQTGTADNLDNITGAAREDGDVVIIQPASGDTITVKNGTGNIICGTDFVMDSINDRMMLLYNGTNWIEISRSDNA